MLKVPSFRMSTRPETFMSLIHCVIDDTLSQASSDLHQRLLQVIAIMNLMSIAFPFMHPC